jgi:ferredoxin--NADP+ reductase
VVDLKQNNYLVAVIGAGPAGLYASQYLARHGVQVGLFNRDIKPGGLAEYGIFPDKYKLRTGLLAQFKRILDMPEIHYQGNVSIGQSGEIKLDQLRQAGIQAFMVTTGAQTNNWLGLPGEDLDGVYQANDIVFHYNHLPAHADMRFTFGSQVAVIGLGNVMMDIVHYLKQEGATRIVTAYGRRGPTEVKFDPQTLEPVADCLDLKAINAAVASVQPQLQALGKDASDFYELMAKARRKAAECDSGLDLRFQFLRSPRRLVGDENGRVRQIIFEVNRLEQRGDQLVSVGTG